jgi:hypothetical protein
MRKAKIVLGMILAPIFWGVVFASMALGLIGGKGFSANDRAYFGVAAGVSFVIVIMGVWLVRLPDRSKEVEEEAVDRDLP